MTGRSTGMNTIARKHRKSKDNGHLILGDVCLLTLYDRCGQPAGYTMIDAADADHVLRYRWSVSPNRTAGSKRSRPVRKYVSAWISGRSVRLHKFIYKANNGYHVHHRDGDPLNNRRSNLVAVSPREHARLDSERRRAAG